MEFVCYLICKFLRENSFRLLCLPCSVDLLYFEAMASGAFFLAAAFLSHQSICKALSVLFSVWILFCVLLVMLQMPPVLQAFLLLAFSLWWGTKRKKERDRALCLLSVCFTCCFFLSLNSALFYILKNTSFLFDNILIVPYLILNVVSPG